MSLVGWFWLVASYILEEVSQILEYFSLLGLKCILTENMSGCCMWFHDFTQHNNYLFSRHIISVYQYQQVDWVSKGDNGNYNFSPAKGYIDSESSGASLPTSSCAAQPLRHFQFSRRGMSKLRITKSTIGVFHAWETDWQTDRVTDRLTADCWLTV